MLLKALKRVQLVERRGPVSAFSELD